MSIYEEQTSAVANEFLELAKIDDATISVAKLMKLMYIAQGLSLALLNKNLFDEPIEAWPYGY